jgi:hypothetical protein
VRVVHEVEELAWNVRSTFGNERPTNVRIVMANLYTDANLCSMHNVGDNTNVKSEGATIGCQNISTRRHICPQ